MAYHIITSTNLVSLKIDVNTYLAANPTYQPVGEPMITLDTKYIQAVAENATSGTTSQYVQIMTALACNANQTSAIATDALLIPQKTVEVQVNVTTTDTGDGVLKLQDSVDGVNYSDISGMSITVTVNTTVNVFRLAESFAGRYIRLVWTKGTNTTGTLNAFLYAK